MRPDQAEDEKLRTPADARDHYQASQRAVLGPSDDKACSAVIGHWTPVTESLPDDEITVLVWMGAMGDATLAYHDSEVLERRGDSGWIMAETVTPGRVLLDVTHWCAKIYPPNAIAQATEI